MTVTGCSTISKSIRSTSQATRTRPRPPRASGSRSSPSTRRSRPESLKGADFYLPEPATQTEWRLPGGNAEQSVEHVDAAKAFEIAWRKGFGQKGNRKFHITAPPVASADRIFVMDGESTVAALDTKTGSIDWRKDLRPAAGPGGKRGMFGFGGAKNDRLGFGGGVAWVADNKLYVSSGFRFVTQLDAASGAEGWRQHGHAGSRRADRRRRPRVRGFNRQ
jgi:outer membrane protein assembly factor BamB